MTPPSHEREKTALPIEAEPIAVHLRLVTLEKTNRVILKRLRVMQAEIKNDVAEGFRKCSESRPCAAPKPSQPTALTVQPIDWSVWGPALQKALAGAAIIGTLIGGVLIGSGSGKDTRQMAVSGNPVQVQPVGSQGTDRNP